MLKTYVDSSTIEMVGWADDTLYVSFKKTGAYSYRGVSEPVYQAMIAADSVGQFFHREIKPAYECTKLAESPLMVATA